MEKSSIGRLLMVSEQLNDTKGEILVIALKSLNNNPGRPGQGQDQE